MHWSVLLQTPASEEILGRDSTSFAIVLSLLTLIIGIIASWFVSRYYYRRGRDKHRLVWTNFTALVADTFTTRNQNVQLSYSDQPVSSVAISWLVFWNSGVDTVRREDLVEDDPIRNEPSSGNQILDVRLVCQNNPSNKLEVVTTSGSAVPEIKFDFLRPSNGAVFQVTHTGRLPSAIQLVGSLKADPQLQRVELTTDRLQALPPNARATVQEMPGTGWISFLFVVLIMILVFGVGGIVFLALSQATGAPWNFVFLAMWTLVSLVASAGLMLRVESRVGPRIPGGLQVLTDDGESTTDYWDRRLPPEFRFPLG